MKGMLLAAVVSLAVGIPDMLPPGERRVVNEFALDWPEQLGKVRFVAAPIVRASRWHEVARGQPFERPRLDMLRLYAVPIDATELPTETAGWRATGWPSTDLPGTPVAVVADASPVHRVRTEVMVEAVDPTTIRCRVVRQVQFDRDGNEVFASGVLVPVTTALLGAVLLFVFARRRAPEPS